MVCIYMSDSVVFIYYNMLNLELSSTEHDILYIFFYNLYIIFVCLLLKCYVNYLR